MYQLCRFPSRDVRFNVTLSPTSTDSEGPGMLSDVFVSPQPVVRLPYSWIGKSRAPAAGTAIPRDPRRRTASVAATRMRRLRVGICIPSVGGARACPPNKSIASTVPMVAKWTLRHARSAFLPRRRGQLMLFPWRLPNRSHARVVGEREDLGWARRHGARVPRRDAVI